jgi:hypothetical protein
VTKTELCLYPGCQKNEHSRGLCKSHYESARRKIAAGVATEIDLMQRGMLLQAKKTSRGPTHDGLLLGSPMRGKKR